jgi:glycosyltransferase involved in cell wall biosynthesis
LKNLDILHIYYGSQGSGGLYLDEIYQTLNDENYRQDVIVSYYYPFNYGNKFFFKYSDLSSGFFKNKLRIIIRLIEYLYGLFRSIVYIFYYKPKVINYSLNRAYIFDLWFVKIINLFTKSKVIITCHDVLPFSSLEKNIESQIKLRKLIFQKANYLLVHNQNSVHELIKYYEIDSKSIFHHPFPIMDLNKINENQNFNKKYDFAFVGHLRKEKGLDFLLEAWLTFHKHNPSAKLLIAGNQSKKIENLDHFKQKNVTFILKYLSDADLYRYMNESCTIILPYYEGTNSGIVFNLATLNVNIIYSNLPMFIENELLQREGEFEKENTTSLLNRMKYYYNNSTSENKSSLVAYKLEFKFKLFDFYNNILSNNY